MIPRSRIIRNPHLRAGVSIRWFLSSAAQHGGNSRRPQLLQDLLDHVNLPISSRLPSNQISRPLTLRLPQTCIAQKSLSTTSRAHAISFRDLKGEGEKKAEARQDRSAPGKGSSEDPTESAREPATPDPDDPAERAYRAAKAESDRERAKAKHKAERARAKAEKEEAKNEDGEEHSKGQKEQKSTQEEPPPPPHGNKSPIEVFMDTMRKEFQASKEWNEGTKQLASSAHQFTENESVKRARAAYSAASGAASSGTASALKGAAKTVGQGAAWTWDTAVVKGVRQGVNATGRAIDSATKPVRETEAFKSVKDVIDDGSSSRYGGWVEKEERRKQRELRELQEAAATGRPGRRAEKMEEDPE